MPLRGPSRLGILTFPQRWEPNSLLVRFLCLPKGRPLDELAAGQPSFATANLVFEANIISGLGRLPRSTDATGLGILVLNNPPVNKNGLFTELDQKFNIQPRVWKPFSQPTFLKPVTKSYRTLTGRRQLSEYLTDEKDFECALHDAHASQPREPEELKDDVTWGQLMAYVLRQPKLAMALGLIGDATIELEDPTVFEKGGWLYVSLHTQSAYAGMAKALYAARVPPLSDERSLYAPVLFPVDGVEVADEIFREAELYDRGFARMVHGAQVEDRGDAIRLAWDDEQIAEWLNRQVHPKTEAPMGTAGYRVDVRRQGGDWNSLVRIKSNGDLTLGTQVLGPYEGESIVEVMPAQIAPGRTEFWMPPYFTTWRGTSLVLTDNNLAALHAELINNPADPSLLLNREKTFVPVTDTVALLHYGETYDFRVRLADLTFGGPPATDDTPPIPHAVTTIKFQRRTRPGPINVISRPTRDDTFVRIAKPRLGYPEALFTGTSFADLRARLVADMAINQEREMSVPDPDVINVEILVEARSLEGDVSTYLPLYTTTRPFNQDEINLALEPRDLPTLDLLLFVQTDNGPLVIPTARDIRLTLTGLGRDDADYFAPPDVQRGVPDFRRGVPITVEVRAAAQSEAPLFNAVEAPLRSFFFRLPPEDGSVASPPQRLAMELDLDHSGLTLSGRKGLRLVFGCSSALRHSLSPERASITFSSSADLIQRWINVLQFDLARDWTWDDLADQGIAIQRRVKRGETEIVELAGTIRLPRAIARTAITGDSPDPRDPGRQSTTILFFDAYDPKPQPGEFPGETTFEYEIAPAFKDPEPSAPAPFTESILVPVATPPVQVPKLVSAGIALSPYSPATDYSFTDARRRSLWLEFDSPPTDPKDVYFIRVLANAPDPMLIDESIAEVIEPPLPIDEEWMRLIEQGQPRDDSGLHAMTPLDQPAPATTHYLLPLPKGLDETSLELFGMFTYEIRVGHTDARWSLAQARYGPPLRVAGVQHPAPPLVCHAARNERTIRVRASFATAVHNGRNVRPRLPRTELWAVLYARVRQTDAASWRNLLLARTRMSPPHDELFTEMDARTLFGEGFFGIHEVNELLLRLGLPDNTPLTTLAVELFKNPLPPDPLGQNLGHARMLRVSPLVPVPDQC